jgi:methylated-DNA-[protein]-cysteine S-methyltransferase
MKQTRLEARASVGTPLGALTLAATARGLALAWFDGQAHRSESVDAPDRPDHPHLALAARELEGYWRDPGQAFSVPLDAEGTDFQRAVWQVLRMIAPGALSTYGEVARRVGRPRAVRAVGAAIGRNPLSIVVPCHRVVGSSGNLTGYAGGLPRKQELLAREAARRAVP